MLVLFEPSPRMGRSPRVRGSRRGRPGEGRNVGSIPACAGEPHDSAIARASCRVDPRVCGGARSPVRQRHSPPGRSPRVRGSPCPADAYQRHHGSIPACAGEPDLLAIEQQRITVDPRVCGGAVPPPRQQFASAGRSPRVRGSPGQLVDRGQHIGSIPACAGEPRWLSCSSRFARVDPRVCGGAEKLRPSNNEVPGRSPRVRGSLASRRVNLSARGSIPACAGEPDRKPRA